MFTTVDTVLRELKVNSKVIAKEHANKGMLLYNPENLKGKYSFIYI